MECGGDNNRLKKEKKFSLKTLLLFIFTAVFALFIKTVPVAEAETQNNGAPFKDEPHKTEITYEKIETEENTGEASGEPEDAGDIEEIEILPAEEDGSPLIIIDPGHGGEDAGCTAGDIFEKDLNLSFALKTETALKNMGYRVVLLRGGDSFLDKYERAEMANKTGGAVLISIHQNSFTDSGVTGTETWYGGADQSSRQLAHTVHKKLLAVTGNRDRGCAYDADLVITNYTNMPSCLVEIGFMSNTAELGRLVSEDFQTEAANSIAEGIDLFLKPNVMYLTFDDGPSKHTEAILDVLKERNIKATFFVIGENVLKYPEIARRIADEGHTIGIHCQNHDYRKLYSSADSYLSDFYEAQNVVYEITGVSSSLFRFPGGSVNNFNKSTYKAIIGEMKKRGFTYFDWNAETGDSVKEPVHDKIIQNAKKSAGSKARVVLLAHDSKSATADSLNEIIDMFDNYTMEPITGGTKPVQFKLP